MKQDTTQNTRCINIDKTLYDIINKVNSFDELCYEVRILATHDTKYVQLNTLLDKLFRGNNKIELEAKFKLLHNFKFETKYRTNENDIKLDYWYDIILPYNTHIASYMMSLINPFVRELEKQKLVTLGDHKEKWGGIVGHIESENKEILVKCLDFILELRAKFPYISSSYTYNLINDEFTEEEKEKYINVNDYRPIKKQ